MAANSSNDGKVAFEGSFTLLGPEVHARYSRSVSTEFVTPGNSGSWFNQLLKTNGSPQRQRATFESPCFDGGRWKVSCAVTEGSDEEPARLEVYLVSESVSWEKQKHRDVIAKLDILEPVGHKSLFQFTLKHVYDSEHWGSWGKHVQLSTLRASTEIATKGQVLIRWAVTEFADSNLHAFLPEAVMSVNRLLEAHSTVMDYKPNVRFLFKSGKVVYGHSGLLKSRSAYLARLLQQSNDEATLRTVEEALAIFPSSSPLDNPEDSDIESATNVTQADTYKNDKIGTVNVADFSYTTFKAFIIWLQTGAISFLPLRSSGNRSERVNAEQQRLGGNVVRFSASPKSIYRLADKYGEDELKKLAHDRIVSEYAIDNALQELGSQFTALFPAFIPIIEKYVTENYVKIINSPLAQSGIDRVQRRADTKEVWLRVLRSASTVQPTVSGGRR